MEVNEEPSILNLHPANPQPKQEVILKAENVYNNTDTCLFCNNCDFITFSQANLSSHNCSNQLSNKLKCPGYQVCQMGYFTSKESLKVHLQIDHRVDDTEIEKLLTSEAQQTDKKSEKPKSKIFIKDVTLLRKPDLPNEINLPNIFDSLDLTTTDDDIFDDFLAGADEPEDFDFDFEEPSIDHDEIIASNILNESSPGKIYVRKNLCQDGEEITAETKSPAFDSSTSKIYVRSHESLTSQPPDDCVIVSPEVPNKISIRDIETLTNPPANSLSSAFTPSIYVRSYDSLVNEKDQPRCKISIKNMDTLIEPTLMHPNILGQAQNLVIHMRPESSNADDVIVVDDSEINKPEATKTAEIEPKVDNQPMTRIPIEMAADAPKKKIKIVKIIRVTKKSTGPLNAVQVVFKCNIGECRLHFSSSKLLNYHKRCHFSDAEIACPECDSRSFKSFHTLHTHLWRHHTIDMDLFKCKLCDFRTPILARLNNFHQKIHSTEKNYGCDVDGCGKRFKNSKQLKNHRQVHKAGAKRPKETDTMKKIRCQICDKGFSSESGLYIHFMEHKNEEKRFICEEKGCEYSTNDHNSFRRHKFQHTKTHQYTCPACDYKSIQSNTYRKHLEKQHKELAESLLFKCGSCKFVTISKSKYDGHVAKHCGDG